VARVRKHGGKAIPGDYKVRDDITGFTYMRSECKFTWDNKLAPKEFYDEKHPQLIVKPRQDKISVADPRPTPEDDANLPFGEGNKDDL